MRFPRWSALRSFASALRACVHSFLIAALDMVHTEEQIRKGVRA